MAANKTILERVNDLLGDDVTAANIPSLLDLMASAINYVADVIPSNSELWKSVTMGTSQDTTAMNFVDAANCKIISVSNTSSSDGIERLCTEIPLDSFRRGEDVTSIFYNQKNTRNPIYTFTEEGDIEVRPTGGVIDIRFFPYKTGTSTFAHDGEVVTLEAIKDFTAIPFPEQASFMLILKICDNIMQVKVSQAVQDEEDQELLNLLSAQSATIKTLGQEEMQRLNVPATFVGDGQ